MEFRVCIWVLLLGIART